MTVSAPQNLPPLDVGALSWTAPPDPYPARYQGLTHGKTVKQLAAALGLTKLTAALVRLESGAHDALRHWHARQDEFMFVLEGCVTLVSDTGAVSLTAGNCCGFRAGRSDGHMLENRSSSPAIVLVFADKSLPDTVTFSDHDMVLHVDHSSARFTRRDGTPYPAADTSP